MFTRLVNAYSRVLIAHPYKTQIATNGPVCGVGDLGAQYLEHTMKVVPEGEVSSPFKVDWLRLGRMTTYGFVVAGPFYCFWYKWLDKFAATRFQSKGVYAFVGGKLLMDQLVMEPPYLLFYFAFDGILQGKNRTEIKDKLMKDFIPAFKVDCCIWPPAQLLNFAFVPVHFQALTTNSICCLWTIVLSYMNNRSNCSDTAPLSPPCHSIFKIPNEVIPISQPSSVTSQPSSLIFPRIVPRLAGPRVDDDS